MPEIVENTNLNQAFAVLEKNGIIAWQNFSCCGTCASAEIWDVTDESREWLGHVFYHEQDAKTLTEAGGTYVAFGSFLAYPRDERDWEALSEVRKEESNEKHRELSVALMKDCIAPVLVRYGLRVDWNGRFDTRPYIDGVEMYNIP